MTTDHSAFIAKHHGTAAHPAGKIMPRKTGRILLLAAAAYLILCVFFVLFLDVPHHAVIAAGMAFTLVTGGAFLFMHLNQACKRGSRDGDLLRQVLEGSRGARLITDGADNLIYANGRFYDLCVGLGTPSLMTLSQLFDQDDETMAHFRLLADQAHRGLTDSIELRSLQDDHERWFQVTAQPISHWAGYIHWRIDEITDQRENDRAIREEREKLIDFTDNAPVGFFSVDQEGRFVFVNATLARWLGQDIQTLLSRGRLHAYFQDMPENARPYDVIANGGAKQVGEVVMKGQGGRTFMASINQAVVHEDHGVVRTRGVVHDLTAERAMRQALKASEDRFQRFFEEAPLGIALLDSDGLLADCNKALAQMLGYDIADLEGRHLESLIDEQDRVSLLTALERIDKGKPAAPMEITLLGRLNTVVAQLYARRMEGSDSIVLHFSDLTQQKSLEEQFVQSQKMQAIGQLAGGVAHDFNNLLTAMIGFCDLLLLRHKPGDPSFSDIMQIKQNANRAANLVRQLLAFSRQQTLRPRVQDITDILTELSHLLRRLIGANIELDVMHGQDLGLVKVDVGQMEQVLINLAVNARDAMDGGGRLTITTSSFRNTEPMERGADTMPPGDWVTIAVEDTGCGIPSDLRDRIFEPFFTTKEVGHGTGLGLATVYGIIRQTGGFLHVDSQLGQGTVFTLYLPRLHDGETVAEAPVEAEEDTTRDLTGTARILLVEDEDAVRTFSSRALGNKGYEVLEADCGEKALSVLAGLDGRFIDLLITDVIMPNMDGPTLAKTVRVDNPTLKIIFISGYTEEKLKDHMGENIWFLPKPFTLKQLAAKVKEALGD